ncbi:hypothetical protein EV182_007493, partial [Spiromyces aspiralis]
IQQQQQEVQSTVAPFQSFSIRYEDEQMAIDEDNSLDAISTLNYTKVSSSAALQTTATSFPMIPAPTVPTMPFANISPSLQRNTITSNYSDDGNSGSKISSGFASPQIQFGLNKQEGSATQKQQQQLQANPGADPQVTVASFDMCNTLRGSWTHQNHVVASRSTKYARYHPYLNSLCKALHRDSQQITPKTGNTPFIPNLAKVMPMMAGASGILGIAAQKSTPDSAPVINNTGLSDSDFITAIANIAPTTVAAG